MAKLLIVEDSPSTRNEIKIIVQKHGIYSETVLAENGEQAIKQTVKEKPDAVILDLEMPRMGGFTFLNWLMKTRPVPVLIFSSNYNEENVFKALDAGAVDFLPKNGEYISLEFENKLVEKLKTLSQSKPRKLIETKELLKKPSSPETCVSDFDLIVIGASTGGPTSIQKLIEELDGIISVPIVVCQHMPKNFTRIFAERIDSKTEHYEVSEAKNGDILKKGKIYVCPGQLHTMVRGNRLEVVPAKGNDIYVPSLDIVLDTAAQSFKQKLLGIVLTGMGKDGLEGARSVKNSGGKIIAESRESCVIYGMPKEIVKNNLHDYVLPLNFMAKKIVELCGVATD